MVTEAETVVNEANETQPAAEAKEESQQPVGPTTVELQVGLTALERNYKQEIDALKSRDGRKDKEIAQLKKGVIALARKQFNEEELPAETSELQSWLKTHLPDEPAQPPPLTKAEQAWIKEMNTELLGVGLTVANFATTMPEVAAQADAAWERGDYGEAYRLIQKAVATKNSTPNPPAKTEVKIPVDRTPSQGGGSRKGFTQQEVAAIPIQEYMANPALREELEAAQRAGRIK